MSAAQVKREIDALADPAQAEILQCFFKTGPGEYGEGDLFVGVKVPPLRQIAKRHKELSLDELDTLLASRIHEHRSTGLIILTNQAIRAELDRRRELAEFYLAHTDRINNWDLVDLSCRDVIGGYLIKLGDWSLLLELAESGDLWERRIAIVSTWAMIREGDLEPTFVVAQRLLGDDEDLIHKAVGWMLREAGKRDERALEQFLDQHLDQLPRTALRYSIERMTPERRKYWLGR